MALTAPPRDAEHFHNPAAVTSLRSAPLLMARFRQNLRFALQALPEGDLAHELAKAVQDMTGSKGKAFTILDNATKEVMK